MLKDWKIKKCRGDFFIAATQNEHVSKMYATYYMSQVQNAV